MPFKNLDSLNPSFAKANTFISTMAILPILLSSIGMVLASGAAEAVPIYNNPIWIGCFIIFCIPIIMVIVPRLLKWSWRAEHFGVSTFILGSVILSGLVPWSCILIYSKLTIFVRVTLFIIYALLVVFWGGKYIGFYKGIFRDEKLRRKIYELNGEYVYYLQKGDRQILDAIPNASHFPSGIIIVLAAGLAFFVLLFWPESSVVIGLPITHIFLAIIAVPIDMMAFGFVVRGLLIYFHYPKIIRKQTGKVVLVDLVSVPAM